MSDFVQNTREILKIVPNSGLLGKVVDGNPQEQHRNHQRIFSQIDPKRYIKSEEGEADPWRLDLPPIQFSRFRLLNFHLSLYR